MPEKLLQYRFIGQTGMPVILTPGACAHLDVGFPYRVRTLPEPVSGGVTASDIEVNPDGSLNFTPSGSPILGGILVTGDGTVAPTAFQGQPILGNENTMHFRMNRDGFTDHAPMTSYSISFLYQIEGTFQLSDTRRFFEVREGNTVRWGLGITGKPLLFLDDSVSNRLVLLEGAGTELVRSHVDFGRVFQYTWYKFEIQVQPTNPKITVRVYTLSLPGGVVTWTLSSLLSLTSPGSSPSSVSANRCSFGIPPDAVGSFNSTIGWKLANIQAWDNTLADSGDGLGNLFPNYDIPEPKIRWGDGTDETPQMVISYWDGTTEHPQTSQLNDPYSMMFRPNEIYFPGVADPGNTQYGTDDPDVQRYLVIKPPGPTPPGGWPYGMWVTTNYFWAGDYSGVLQYHNDMLTHILQMGVAVVSTGVRLARPDGSRKTFPHAILDAKLAARHVQANRTDLNHSKRVAMGHSSGGHISGGALISRNLTNNGPGPGPNQGKDLTLNGNGYGGGPGSDPDYIGSLLFSPAIDMRRTWAEDPTFPHVFGYGGAQLAITAYLGEAPGTNPPNLDGVNLHEWIPLNASNQRPTYVIGADGDTVVPKHNGITLRDTLLANGISNAVFENIGLVTHPEVTSQFTHLWKDWLKTLMGI